MKMVPHDAVRKYSHRDAIRGLGYDAQERVEVARLVKQRLAMVTAIQDVLDKNIGRNASMSWHAEDMSTSMPLSRLEKRGLSPFPWGETGTVPVFRRRSGIESRIANRESRIANRARIRDSGSGIRDPGLGIRGSRIKDQGFMTVRQWCRRVAASCSRPPEPSGGRASS